MIILIDNYDSFTYNLYQYMIEVGAEVKVYRNDEKKISEIEKLNPEKLVVSPGPSNPENAGISERLIKVLSVRIPILGVCLGHQCIVEALGGEITYAKKLMHGKTSIIQNKNLGILKNLPKKFEATRYHSLIVDKKNLSKDLIITAEIKDGIIMGLMHKKYNIHGVQFHPESIKTPIGLKLLKNFINYN